MHAYRSGRALPLDELRDEFDHLWSTLTTAPPLHGWGRDRGESLFPAVNVSERDDAIVIEAELPGLDVADVDIAATAEEIVFQGQRPAATAAGGDGEKGITWLRRERGAGGFERRLALPVAIDPARVEGKLVDGVLTVTCPKAPESQPHKIPVHAS
jgi:HSP20 family protein